MTLTSQHSPQRAEGQHSPAGGLRRLVPLTAWAPAGALAIFLLAAVRAGLDPTDLARGLSAIGLTQVVPGLLLWRVVRPRQGWWIEDVVMGVALGAMLAIATQAMFASAWTSMAVGPALALGLLIAPGSRSRIASARSQPLHWAWGPLVSLVSLLLLVPTQGFYRTNPYEWGEGFRALYVDMPFHLSLVGQLASRGPSSVPYVLGEPLQYHWFSHAWMAHSSSVSGVPADAVLLRLFPPLIAVVTVVAVAVATLRIASRPWAGPLAALLAVSAGDISFVKGPLPGTLVYHISPSLAPATILSLALFTVFAIRWRGERVVGGFAWVAVLGFAAVGTKGSALPVLIAGTALAAAASVLWRTPARKVLVVDLGMLVLSLLLASMTVFQGQSPGLHLDPQAALRAAAPARFLHDGMSTLPASIMLGAIALTLLAALGRGAGLVGVLVADWRRRDPVLVFLLGTGLAGALAVVALAHDGKSQWYFLRSAAPFLAIGSGVGVSLLLGQLRSSGRRAAVAGLVAGGLVTGVVALGGGATQSQPSLLRVFGSHAAAAALLAIAATVTVKWFGEPNRANARVVGAACTSIALLVFAVAPVALRQVTSLPAYSSAVAPGSPAFSADQIDAARQLKVLSAPGDIVATNRHCRQSAASVCDNRRFYVAAYTERQVLVEGWGYTTRSVTEATDALDDAYVPYWRPDVLDTNDRFLTQPGPADHTRLYELGVRWIFVDKTSPYSPDLVRFGREHVDTEWAWVLELAPP